MNASKPVQKTTASALICSRSVTSQVRAKLRGPIASISAATRSKSGRLRAVTATPHCTADDVVDGVRREIGAISKQAAYDALRVLVEKGLLRRIQPAHSPARYEDRVGDNHHHLICRDCGLMMDVDCAVGAAPCLTPSDDAGYEIDEAEVIYWGRCPSCVKRSPSKH